MRPDFVERSIAHRRQIAWIVWGAFVGSILVYGLTAFVMKSTGQLKPPPVHPVLPVALLAMGLVSAVSAVALRVLMVTPDRVLPDRNAPEWKPQGPLREDLRPDSPQEGRFVQALQRSSVMTVVTWAMMESSAVFGLVLFFLTGQMTHAAVLWGAGLVGFLAVMPPGRDFYHELVRKVV